MDDTITSRTPTPAAAPVRARLRAAGWLSGVVVLLTAVAAATGLWSDGLYSGPVELVAKFRGNDLTTLVAGAPLLALALAWSVRGSRRAHVVWLGMLAYSVYNYAYYVYDPAFTDLFLLHTGILVLSATALALLLSDLDVTVFERDAARPAVRWVAALLFLLAVTMVGIYVVALVRQIVAGETPQDALPLPSEQAHLGYALDLTMIAPSLVLAAVLMWRRTPWGYALGTATCVYVGLYQLNYIVARYFIAEAGVPDVPHVYGPDLLIPALLLAAVLALLIPARSRRGPDVSPT